MTLFTDYVRYEPLDHVNLEFTNPDDPDPVNILQAVLNVLSGQGWKQGVQGHQYLEERTDNTFRRERSWRTRDLLIGGIKRFHVRLWHDKQSVVGLAHREFVGLWPLNHYVDSFDLGKYEIEQVFASAGWHVSSDAYPHTTPIDYPPSNGRVSVLEHP